MYEPITACATRCVSSLHAMAKMTAAAENADRTRIAARAHNSCAAAGIRTRAAERTMMMTQINRSGSAASPLACSASPYSWRWTPMSRRTHSAIRSMSLTMAAAASPAAGGLQQRKGEGQALRSPSISRLRQKEPRQPHMQQRYRARLASHWCPVPSEAGEEPGLERRTRNAIKQ